MKKLKFLIFILLTITILSCYSVNNPDCCYSEITWERAGNLPDFLVCEITVASDGNIWAYSSYDQSELYLSTDNGDTWNKKGNLPVTRSPWVLGLRLQVNPINGLLFLASDYGELYRSTDNGANWENIMDNMIISGFLITASGEIYVGCEKLYTLQNFCYYSSDNGNTWIEKSSGLPNRFALLAIGTDGTLYAGSWEKGVYRSTDNGYHWLSPSNYKNAGINDLAICDGGLIFAVAGAPDILKSTNKGANWTQITELKADATNSIVYNPITKDIFVNNGVKDFENHYKIYRSTNLGESWRSENTGLPLYEYGLANGNLAFNSTTGQMFVATIDGVYRTKNYPK